MTLIYLALLGTTTLAAIAYKAALTAISALKDMDDRLNAVWDDYLDTEIEWVLAEGEVEDLPQWEDDRWE